MEKRDKQLSIVMVGRNDNYGGDFKSRLQLCLKWTFHHLTINKINSEIIFVNYNPLPDSDILNFVEWPVSNHLVDMIILTVSNSHHQNFVKKHSVVDVPVLEYPAKNAGIRRSKGEFVLSMNPDVLIDERNFGYFHHLSNDNFYRLDRIDYAGDVEIKMSDSLFDVLKEKLRLVWYKGTPYDCNGISETKYYILKKLRSIENFWKAHNIKLKFLLDLLMINSYSHNVGFKLHTNASGDFLLMSKTAWEKLKGYRENAPVALHNDSMMVVQAYTLNLKEIILKYPAFHKDHERRYDSLETDKYRNIFLEYNTYAQSMIKQNSPHLFNDANWGFAQFDLAAKKIL